MTRATIEAQNLRSEVPEFGSLRPLPKTDLEKNNTCYRMKNLMA